MTMTKRTTIEKTTSICPVCLERVRPLKALDAELFEEEGQIFIDRKCPKHPDEDLKELVSSHAGIFHRLKSLYDKFAPKDTKLSNPGSETTYGCPNDCGICPEHQSSTVLSIIDVTNTCNMKCPTCFARAGEGALYLLPKEVVFKMIDKLRENKPNPPPALQFSGGEPTLHKDLVEMVKYAAAKGFKHIEINTNGLRIAAEGGAEYWKQLIDAGVSSAYLQFDGVDDEVYKKTRGMDGLFEVKKRTMENMRKAGEDNIVLTVTLEKGVNDHQIGAIIQFAEDNQDLVKGINFQPVSFAGRIDYSKRKEMRITPTDLIKLAEEQTSGQLKSEYWFPINIINPVIRLARRLTKHHPPDFSPSVYCGVLTMLVKDEEEKFRALPSMMNVEKFMENVDKAEKSLQKGGLLSKVEAYARLNWASFRYVDPLPRKYLLDLLKQTRKESYGVLSEWMKMGLFIGCMHFQDPYNYDLKRLSQCVVHYAVPGGGIIPFCTQNNLGYRQEQEKELAQKYPLIAVPQ